MNNLLQTTLIALALLLITGCGQMGGLYLPADDKSGTTTSDAPAPGTAVPVESISIEEVPGATAPGAMAPNAT